jgi:hypothetical protein
LRYDAAINMLMDGGSDALAYARSMLPDFELIEKFFKMRWVNTLVLFARLSAVVGHRIDADRCFREALQIEFHESHLAAYAEFLLRSSLACEAYDLLRPHQDLRKRDPYLAMAFAEACLCIGDIKTAVAVLDHMLSQFKGEPVYWARLKRAQVYWESGDRQKATDVATPLANLPSEMKEHAFYRACGRHLSGRQTEARGILIENDLNPGLMDEMFPR